MGLGLGFGPRPGASRFPAASVEPVELVETVFALRLIPSRRAVRLGFRVERRVPEGVVEETLGASQQRRVDGPPARPQGVKIAPGGIVFLQIGQVVVEILVGARALHGVFLPNDRR